MIKKKVFFFRLIGSQAFISRKDVIRKLLLSGKPIAEHSDPSNATARETSVI